MPDAARISDLHACPKIKPGPIPHVGGPIVTGSKNVIVGFRPAARVKDLALCVPAAAVARINKGSRTVFINNLAAARVGDKTNHRSVIVDGCPTVIIGDTPQSFCMHTAATHGTPFCEESEPEKSHDEHDEHDEQDEHDAAPPEESATRDDLVPPPGAIPAAARRVDWTKLAQEPNVGDGLDEARRAAREKVAWDFYSQQFPDWPPHRIESHIRGIDLEKPVQVIIVPRRGTGSNGDTLYQWSAQGATKYGQYFALTPGVSPSTMGVRPDALPFVNGVQAPPAAPRVEDIVHFPDEPIGAGLLSTAAPIVDDWTIKHDPYQTVGGGQQLMIPSKYHPPWSPTP